MTTQSTMDKLIEMHLTAMSDAFRAQLDDPKMKDVAFVDRFSMLVDIEYSNRKNNSLKRLIRNATFDQPEACIQDINYTSGRKLNRGLIERLATCWCHWERQDLYGLCFWNGSLQTAVQDQIHPTSRPAHRTGDGT